MAAGQGWPALSGMAAALRKPNTMSSSPSTATAIGGAATIVRSTSAVNVAVASCTATVEWANWKAVMTGKAAAASTESTTKGPPA